MALQRFYILKGFGVKEEPEKYERTFVILQIFCKEIGINNFFQ